jgi:Na+-driven multidrug efflux pump
MSLLASIANIGFNYVLIAVLDMGIAGSAYVTAAAQALAFAIICAFRVVWETPLRPATLLSHFLPEKWGGGSSYWAHLKA